MPNIVYKVKNEITDEIYIGVTSNSLENRIRDHLQKATKGLGYSFQEAIRTYGPDAFSWKQIDTAENPNDLAAKEKEYILKYSSIEKGYNSDSGGGIKKNVYQYNLEDGNLLYSYSDLESAGSAVSVDKKSISKACLGEIKNCKGFCWSYQLSDNFQPEPDRRRKQVFQFNFEGKFIENFKSVSKASEVTGINKSSIAKCCRGEYKSAGNYCWRYSE